MVGQGDLGFQDVTQADDFPVPCLVRDLHADRGLSGDRGQDPHVGALDGVGDVLAQRGDLFDLHRGAELDLVPGHLRAAAVAGHLRVDLELLEHLREGGHRDVARGGDPLRDGAGLQDGDAGRGVLVLRSEPVTCASPWNSSSTCVRAATVTLLAAVIRCGTGPDSRTAMPGAAYSSSSRVGWRAGPDGAGSCTAAMGTVTSGSSACTGGAGSSWTVRRPAAASWALVPARSQPPARSTRSAIWVTPVTRPASRIHVAAAAADTDRCRRAGGRALRSLDQVMPQTGPAARRIFTGSGARACTAAASSHTAGSHRKGLTNTP